MIEPAIEKLDFCVDLDRKLALCSESDEYYTSFLESFASSHVYYVEYNEFSGQFTLMSQNSLCPKNSLWLNTKLSGLKMDERSNFKSFKEEIRKICNGLSEIKDLPLVEVSVLTICQKITGLFIGFSDNNEMHSLSAATKILSCYLSQEAAPSKKLSSKKSFLLNVDNEISRSRKTKNPFGIVSFFIEEEIRDLFFIKSLNKLFHQKISFSEDFLIRENGNIIVLKNHMDRDELVLWSYGMREALKELSLKLFGSEKIKIGVGISLYPEHGSSGNELIIMANKACSESLKTHNEKIGLAHRSPGFKKDFEISL